MPLRKIRPKVLLPLFFALLILALAGGLWWQRSALLQQVPSRYLARLPAPLQTLTAPPAQAPLLPTAPPPLVSVSERAGVAVEARPTAPAVTRMPAALTIEIIASAVRSCWRRRSNCCQKDNQ